MRPGSLLIVFIMFLSPLYAQIISGEGTSTGTRNYGSLGQRQFYILGTINTALPFGDYSSADYFNPDAGYARAGFHGQVSVGRVFRKVIGVAGSAGIIYHPVNKERLENILSANYGSLISDFEYKGYYHYYVDGGLLLSFAVTPTMDFDFRLLGGVSYGVDSEASFKYTRNNTVYRDQADKAGDVALLINPGMTLRMRVKDRLVISGNVDYMFAAYSLDDVPYRSNGIIVATGSYDLIMHNISFGLGIGITIR